LITNERQYRITKAEARKFQVAIEAQEGSAPGKGIDSRVHEAMGAALRSEADLLSEEIKRYEDLRAGRINRRSLDGMRELPDALIEARIAAGLTQKEIAERLGLREQQVQRWEAGRYAGVGVERLQEIADALGMEVREEVTYTVAA